MALEEGRVLQRRVSLGMEVNWLRKCKRESLCKEFVMSKVGMEVIRDRERREICIAFAVHNIR